MRAVLPYRADTCSAFEVRWLLRPCGGWVCWGAHPTAVVSFDGADRWAACVRCPVDFAEEDDILEQIEENEDSYRLVVAAFGLPWSVLVAHGGDWLIRQEVEVFERPALVGRELGRHDVEGVLSLRRMVGRELAAMTQALVLLGSYRENVGGENGVFDG